jgi:hypothetical protein
MSGRRRVAIFNDTAPERHHGCTAVMSYIVGACEAAGLEVVLRHPLGAEWRDSAKIEEILGSCALVLINGEGTFRDDNSASKKLAALGPYCRARSIPCALINASLVNLNSVFDDLRSMDLIFVRDSASAEAARRAGIRAEVTGDLSFGQVFSDVRPELAEQKIVFTDSILIRATIALQQDARLLGADVLPIGESLYAPHFSDYVRLLGAYGFVVTGRYHGVCFCINAGIPFVAVPANTDRIASLLSDVFGNSARMQHWSKLHSPGVAFSGLFEEVFGRRPMKNKSREKLLALLGPLRAYDLKERDCIARHKARVDDARQSMWECILNL